MSARAPLPNPREPRLASRGGRPGQGNAATAMSNPLLLGDDVQFWCETLRVLGAGECGGSQFGGIAATAPRIRAGDYNSWRDAWSASADSHR